MPALNSSAIEFVSYEPASQRLHVTFRHGGTYTYFGVPPDVYEDLIDADSPGTYFNEVIAQLYGLR